MVQPFVPHGDERMEWQPFASSGLVFDEQGQCGFELASGHELVMSRHAGGITIRLTLGPADKRSTRSALVWNYDSPVPGLRIGQCPQSGLLALLGWVDPQRPEELESAVATMLHEAEQFRQTPEDAQPSGFQTFMDGMRP